VRAESLTRGYRHEALLYSGLTDFVQHTAPFVRESLEVGQPILIVVPEPRLSALREALGDTDGAILIDMTMVGRNPGRILGLWHSFVAEHRDAAQIRGIGEPIYAGRSPAEVSECQIHETLLNNAFGASTQLWLQCPYDTDALPEETLAKALGTHPVFAKGGATASSPRYERADPRSVLEAELSEPPPDAHQLAFGADDLAAVRSYIARHAEGSELAAERLHTLLLVVSELAANSIRHGGGGGTLSMWNEPGRVVADVRDSGTLTDPFVGRFRPSTTTASGRGLWLANQMSDLVQTRSTAGCTRVRVAIGTG
jgi:anti-sigma regulatory factor (Ser/Thr protein kinase)